MKVSVQLKGNMGLPNDRPSSLQKSVQVAIKEMDIKHVWV